MTPFGAAWRGRARWLLRGLLLSGGVLVMAIGAARAADVALRWSALIGIEPEPVDDGFLAVDGRRIRLAAVILPEPGTRKADGSDLAASCRALLRRIASAGIRLDASSQRRNRYGDLEAQLADRGGRWIQKELLTRGCALRDPLRAGEDEWRDLAPAEKAARRARRGIWSIFPRPADRLAEPRGEPRFAIVEGRPLRLERRRVFLYLNFGEDRRRDFTVRIPRRLVRFLRRRGVDPETLVGRRILLRGWLFSAGGPMLELVHPRQVEVLQ